MHRRQQQHQRQLHRQPPAAKPARARRQIHPAGQRARYAIQTIARLVGNSASEPAATGSQPLDAWTVAALMGGVEGLCDHLGTLTDAMLESARAYADDAAFDATTHNAPRSIQ
ncbi:hypothetical protein L7A47_30765 [Achromobacter xylosoxidans]|uniref:hypothetical protein n=1 Tax=Alcaligenes xylosoxydans xylosoxydans TaxID=85698 RepID=UPI001F0F1FA1|nr:hypothetical protein [Achromobacter xylosoxidans]